MPPVLAKIIPESWYENVIYYGGPWLRIFYNRGARFALTGAFLGAISINFDALITRELNLATGPGFVMLFVGIATFIFMAFNGGFGRLRSGSLPWGVISCIIFIYAISNILMASGYLLQLTPYAGSLKRTQILWTVIIATMYLGEGFAKTRIIGAAIITAGAILVSIA